MPDTVKILFLGDIVGGAGRRGVKSALPVLREQFEPNFVIVNCENAAGGMGITEKIGNSLFETGIDVLTLGNHAFRQKDSYAFLDSENRIIRPANYLSSNPGRGSTVVEKDGVRYGVANLSGTLLMHAAHSPFIGVDPLVEELGRESDITIIDFHAETTSEKIAMGWYLDGRVTAVLGTHTHVQTADARILPKGTAYITDVGMCGPHDSVLGVKKELVLERFLTQMPVKFETAEGDVQINGVLVEVEPGGKALSIAAFNEAVEE